MAESHVAPAVEVTVILPGTQARPWAWRELWGHRELLSFLVWRDLKVRYKQTALGAMWAVIQPLATMVVFSIIFGRLGQMPSDGVPYPVFSYAALVPWTYFAAALGSGAASLVGSQSLLSKVYFPRLVIPAASVLVPLVDAAIALAMLFVLMAWYGIAPTPALVWLPAFTALAVAAAAGASLWLSALNVKYRDVRYVVPFLVQFWLFVTPVIYPTSLVPAPWKAAYGLNPMATVIEGFRWALIGAAPPDPAMVAASVASTGVLLWAGLRYFRRMEGLFADVL